MYKQTLSLVAAATLAASLEANTLQLKPIAITSNAIETDELRAPYAAEIYTAAQIEASHTNNIYDFLATQSSLFIAPTYNNPFARPIDVHGYGTADTGYQNIVVTLNGRRLNNVDMSPQMLGSIPVSTIERIEILKGAGSVVYGDGANAAVINIITKQETQNQLTLSGGSYHTQSESLYLSGVKEKFSYSVHLDHFDTGGMRDLDSKGLNDSQKSTNGGISLNYRPNSVTEVYGSADFTRNNSLYGGTLTLDQYRTNPSQQGSADNGYGYNSSPIMSHVFSSQAVTLGVKEILPKGFVFDTSVAQEIKSNAFVSTSFDGVYPNINATYVTPYNSNYLYRQINTNLRYDGESLNTIVGFQGTQGKVDWSRGVHSQKSNSALFVSGDYQNGNSLYSIGGRYEKAFYQYEDNVTPLTKTDKALYAYEMGYSYLLDAEQSLFVHYGHAFQFPDLDRITLVDFTWPYTDPTRFNGFLNPMKTDTYTIGYTKIDGETKIKASLYYVQLKDEIYFYSNDLAWIATLTSNTNIEKSHKYGLDLSYLRTLNDQWKMGLGYNYVKAIIDDEKIDGKDFSGNELPGVSNHSAQATLTYMPNEHTSVALSEVYRSKAYAQLDFGNDFTQKQDAYYSTNMIVNYAKDNYEVFVTINNLFDHTNGVWIRDNQIYPVDFKRTVSAGIKFIF